MFFRETGPFKMIGDDQVQFIKLLVEDPEFFHLVNDRVDQNWFREPEMRHIIRTVQELYAEVGKATYGMVLEAMRPHYDLSIENKEMSWIIINEVLEDAENAGDFGWKKLFLHQIDEEITSMDAPANWS